GELRLFCNNNKKCLITAKNKDDKTQSQLMHISMLNNAKKKSYCNVLLLIFHSISDGTIN
uniref:hypothetical protein n=1 Tax=Photorhabdus bodei TaxID=2029681 RepID=UPI001E37B189